MTQSLDGMPPAAWAYVISQEACQATLAVTVEPEEALQLEADFKAWAPTQTVVCFLSSGETPYSRMSAEPKAQRSRLGLMAKLALGEQPNLIICDAQALGRRLEDPSRFAQRCRLLSPGDILDRAELLADLQAWGYYPASQVEEPGTFATRGSVVDLWPPSEPRPLRLDFFGDELESLRPFEPGRQQRYQGLELLTFGPARLVEPGPDLLRERKVHLLELAERQKLPSEQVRQFLDRLEAGIQDPQLQALEPALVDLDSDLLDWLSPETRLVLCDPKGIDRSLGEIDGRFFQAYEAMIGDHLASPPDEHRLDQDSLRQRLRQQDRLDLNPSSPDGDAVFADHQELVAKLRLSPQKDQDRLAPLSQQIRRWADRGYRTVLSTTPGRRERLRQRLENLSLGLRNLPAFSGPEGWDDCDPGDGSVHLWLAESHHRRGLIDHQKSRVLLVEDELLARHRRPQQRKTRARFRASLDQLATGDLVVHLDYGIAAYQGLTRRVIDGVAMDFLRLDFRGEDKVFVPVARVAVLRRYDGGGRPKLDKIGGTSWQNRRKKVRRGLLEIAHRLAQTQARRQSSQVLPIPHPGPLMADFDAGFPFELTTDQDQALAAIHRDLESDRPMDRLLCGDVGFGKTEVALRAAFSAVAAGQQVALLCPTTVLCHQHLRTFRTRLGEFGIRVAGVSRLSSSQELAATEQGLTQGSVEVVIGTHRLLSPRFRYAKLGLLIVDEEQRFGVKHKERLKELKASVNILTMTATPIPRTLQFALLGLRELSLIETAPADRRSVRTALAPYSESLIKEVIERELQRGGQVFFLHNQIKTLPGMAHLLSSLVPQARVGMAHGKMNPEQLEEVMVRFTEGDLDLLASTSIIEAGLDIPRANTILIDRADHFGLTQLHQIRGRVGRRSERAYCYLLIRKPEAGLSEAARLRLDALQRFSTLGAGFQVARADLDQRGAGNLLGEDQSGQVAQVGIDLYLDLLAEALAQVQGGDGEMMDRLELKLGRSAAIPHHFMPDAAERLALYERVSRLRNDEDIDRLEEELSDEFGGLPDEVEALLLSARIRWRSLPLQLAQLQALRDNDERWQLTASFHGETTSVKPEDLVAWVSDPKRCCHLTRSGRLVHRPAKAQPDDDPGLLLLQFVQSLSELLRQEA